MRQACFGRCGIGLTAYLFVAIWAATAAASPPQVTESVPANGAEDVDPALREIRVTFDQDMNRSAYSWVGGGPSYPSTRGKPRWVNARTCVLPVKLLPNHEYWLSVNNASFQNFRSKTGEPAIPYPLSFKTGRARGGTSSQANAEPEIDDMERDGEVLEFALRDTFGREVRSEDYRGVPLAVMCGACWCGGCQQDARPFGDLAAEFGPRGVQFIRSVSCDNDLTSLEFQKHYRLPVVHLLDPNRTFEKRYNDDGWTFVMLVDRTGKVVYRVNNPDFSTLAPRLEKLLSKPVDAKPIVRDGVSYMRATLERTGELDKARTSDRFPSLASGPDGRLYLVFTSNRRGNSDVFLRVYDGEKWSDDQPIAATEADEDDGVVLVDAQKRVWVSWTSDADGKNYNVFLTMLDASGKPDKPMQLTQANDDAMHARTTCDRKGRIWCVYYRWHKLGHFSRDKEVYIRRYNGMDWSPEARVSPTDVPDYEDHGDPIVVPYGDGVVVAWSWDYHKPRGYTQEAENPTVFLRPIGDDFKLGPVAHASGRSIDVTPTVAVDGKYRIWCAWDALDWDDQLGALRKSLRVCQRDLGSRRAQTAQLISPLLVNVCSPGLVFSPSGGLSLIWSQNEEGDRWALCQADWDTEQAKWSETNRVVSEGKPRFPSAAYGADGTLWIAYSADSGTGREIRTKATKAQGR